MMILIIAGLMVSAVSSRAQTGPGNLWGLLPTKSERIQRRLAKQHVRADQVERDAESIEYTVHVPSSRAPKGMTLAQVQHQIELDAAWFRLQLQRSDNQGHLMQYAMPAPNASRLPANGLGIPGGQGGAAGVGGLAGYVFGRMILP